MSALGACAGRTSRVASRLLVTAIGVTLGMAVAHPGRAGAVDRVIARDTHIGRVLALDGIVVYSVERPPSPPERWMRIVNGRVTRARGMARGYAQAGGIGLDSHGRVVVAFARDGTWQIYDVATDRSRPVHGLPASSPCFELAISGRRLAYADCRYVYLRARNRTHKVPIPTGLTWWPENGSGRLTLNGSALFGEPSDGSDGNYLSLLADASGFCKQVIPGLGDGDAGDLSGWWLSSRYLTWTMYPSDALMGARLTSRCGVPGPAGLLFTAPPQTSVMAVDGRFAYYGTSTTIRRHRLPATPAAAAPPPNDDFERATPLNGDAPLSLDGVVGSATAQRGEPIFTYPGLPAPATHSIWYAFRPTVTGRVTVSVMAAFAAGAWPANTVFGVFTGTTLRTLAGAAAGPADPPIAIDAVAGQTYWIAVASAEIDPGLVTFTLRLQPTTGS